MQRSVITDHRIQNHEFDWINVEILDRELISGKRLISEMIYIKRQKNSLNLIMLNCICHSFAIIASKVCEKLTPLCENLIRGVATYISDSAEICNFTSKNFSNVND